MNAHPSLRSNLKRSRIRENSGCEDSAEHLPRPNSHEFGYKGTHLLPALLFLVSGLWSLASGAAGAPNILFFFIDDMGWQETSVPFHTKPTKLNREYRTPNMERLAADGLLFTNAYACSVCSPSRVSLMTGQNAARHRVTCWTLRKSKSPERGNKTLNPSNWNLNGLQPVGANIPRSVEATTLPGLLRDAGYRTIHAGKAHFGAADTPGADPRNLGFDVNIAGHAAGGPGSYHGDKNFSAAWRKGDRIWDVPGLEKYHGEKINLTEAITREAIAELERAVADKKPFYLYMSHYTVHAPWEADRRFIDGARERSLKGQQATLASMLESMDKSLGDLLDTLDRLGVADNTIVVFMSDNGAPKQCPQNLPLRGHKISAYEGGARVPMIVHWPGATKPATRTDSQILIEDIFPTFLGMAGVQVPNDPSIDGHSFIPVLKNPASAKPRPPIIWHYPNLYDQPPYSSIRHGDWKLIYWHATRKLELFNLKSDIGESTNLADKNPEQLRTLATALSDHLRKTNAVMPIDKATNKPVPLPDTALR